MRLPNLITQGMGTAYGIATAVVGAPAGDPAKKYWFRVSPGLTRGSLLEPGVGLPPSIKPYRAIVDLCAERTASADFAKQHGLKELKLPVIDNTSPSPTQIRQFLDFVTAPDNQPAYVHCQQGKGRTGVAVACYRMAVEGWSVERALAEAEQFGCRMPVQRDSIRAFGTALSRGEVLGYPLVQFDPVAVPQSKPSMDAGAARPPSAPISTLFGPRVGDSPARALADFQRSFQLLHNYAKWSTAQSRDPQWVKGMDADGHRLRAQLETDPLYAAQLRLTKPMTAGDYAESIRTALQHYQAIAAQQKLPPLRIGSHGVSDSIRDMGNAVTTGPGEFLAGLRDPRAEIGLLARIVSKAREEARPLGLGEILGLALELTEGDIAAALRLSAQATQNVTRVPGLYLQYAKENGIDPKAFGLSTRNVKFAYSAAIGFMARYVQDPSGQNYGLNWKGLGKAGAEEYGPGRENSLLAPLDLTGVPYHNFDVLRLALVNSIVPPEALDEVLNLYYGEGLKKVGYREPQLPQKVAADMLALEGAKKVLSGGEWSVFQDRARTLLAAPVAVEMMNSAGWLVGAGAAHGARLFHPDTWVRALVPWLPAPQRPIEAAKAAPEPPQPPKKLLPLFAEGDLGADGFPLPEWLSSVQTIAPLPRADFPISGS